MPYIYTILTLYTYSTHWRLVLQLRWLQQQQLQCLWRPPVQLSSAVLAELDQHWVGRGGWEESVPVGEGWYHQQCQVCIIIPTSHIAHNYIPMEAKYRRCTKHSHSKARVLTRPTRRNCPPRSNRFMDAIASAELL